MDEIQQCRGGCVSRTGWVLTAMRAAAACSVYPPRRANAFGVSASETIVAACDHRFYLATFDSARLKSHRRKSGKRGERSTRGSRGSPPRLVADDSVRLDTPIQLVRFNSGFGFRAKVTIHSARISRRS